MLLVGDYVNISGINGNDIVEWNNVRFIDVNQNCVSFMRSNNSFHSTPNSIIHKIEKLNKRYVPEQGADEYWEWQVELAGNKTIAEQHRDYLIHWVLGFKVNITIKMLIEYFSERLNLKDLTLLVDTFDSKSFRSDNYTPKFNKMLLELLQDLNRHDLLLDFIKHYLDNTFID